jgi:DnaJ-class molecular chaperone
MSVEDPFTILEIAPTRDLAIIKRAYFAGLAKWPPHAAPEAFRKLRSAYETLSDPRACLLAFLRAPFDVEGELARFADEWGARLQEAALRDRAQRRSERAAASFMDRIGRMTLGEVSAFKP